MSLSALKLIFSKTIRVWAARGSLGRIGDLLDRPGAVVAGLALVLLIAALFRFNGLSWDSDQKLHPDERFLISVTDDLRWPDTFETYFDPQTSTLSPYALPDMGLFVYGTLPVYLVKSTAILLDVDTEDAITLIGRSLSALFDLGTILFLFLIGRQLYGSKVGLLAAILLSLSVLDIQLAHFYAVDTFACFFVVATIYVILRASSSGRWSTYALAGLLFGLGLASKLSAAILAVPIGLGLAIDLARRLRDGNDARRAFGHTLARALTVFAIAALVFRVVQPIAFAGPGFWNWSLNSRWLADIDEQRLIIAGEEDMPWLQQWVGRSASFALYNIVIWGLGVPLGLAALAGLGLAIYDLIWRRRLEHLLPAAFVAVMFAYHASAFAKFMRYFLPIYPFLALMAAWLLVRILDFRFRIFERLPTIHNPKSKIAWLPLLLVVSATLLYALAFSAIYSQPHTRVAASRWMFANIAPGATLANEAWDDWLPLDVDGKVAFGKRGLFKDVELPNYDDDTPDKLDQLVDYLTQADYVVLSSNRLYDSIPRLPLRYPMTSRYYALLLAGELGFERVAQFVSYPTLFGIQIPDQAAEESFTVYDHPRVQIFKKTPAFDTEQARRLLGDGVDWDMALPIGPRQASAAPAGLLLSKPERDLYQQAAQWSSAGVSDLSWGSQWPALAWFLAIQALGMLALTPTLVACGHLTDRGYSFSKAIGLLIVGWGAWLLASVRTAPFASPTIVAVMALLAIATWLLRARWAELIAFARARWRLLLLEEILFWCFFALALAIRWRNPDLWHPFLGGQKPMDLAYLTAIVRTPYFPAYDPWFAGGYINYSYFGFTLVATLIHLTGVVPAIAYNLAVPMCFAMTALGGFALALNLAEGRDGTHSTEPPDQGARPTRFGVGRSALIAGLLGALFVALIGNLAQAQLLWDALAQWLRERPLGFRAEWWYWNATRAIPHASGEAGPINEMPVFTYLFADLHAHAMALPYTLLTLGLALELIRDPAQPSLARTQWRATPELLTLALLALTLGALWPINSWDAPAYTAVAIAALACREFARRGRVDLKGVWEVVWRAALVIALGQLLFLPFHQTYASDDFGAQLWQGSRTPLRAFLLINGLFLFVIISYLLLELTCGEGANALARSLRLHLRRRDRLARLRRLVARLVRPTPGYRLAVVVVQALLVAALALLPLSRVVGLALALLLLTALLLPRRRPDPPRQFVLCMTGLGLALAVLPELVALSGDIGRVNTLFTAYLQIWVLWGVCAATVLPQIARRLNGAIGAPPPTVKPAEEARSRAVASPQPPRAWMRRAWWLAFGALLAACALYPLTATPARIRDRFKDSRATSLDGAAYMRTSVYDDQGQQVRLDWDRQAIDWLRHNAPPMATILEANTPAYRWGSRVAIYSGLPSVIGWAGHQKQQRWVLPGWAIDQRVEDARTIYTSTDAAQAERLLARYGVRYIYVGPLERIYYGDVGLKKFDQQDRLWSLVYQNEEVKIYAVR